MKMVERRIVGMQDNADGFYTACNRMIERLDVPFR